MKNVSTYIENLEKGMKNKLFFLDYVDLSEYGLIVDFGCGNGRLIGEMAKVNPNKNTIYIGYDTSQIMLESCKMYEAENTIFTSDIEYIKMLRTECKNLIIFSSVLHEVGSQYQKFLRKEIMPLFDTIIIRDMKQPLNNEPISNTTRERVLKQVAPWQAEMFEQKWGKITDKIGLYRFFLMNEFVDNFETELEEDYFSVEWSEIRLYLEELGYNTTYERSYTLPYRYKQVKKRFTHTMNDITHRELIMNRKEENNDK